MVNKDYHIRADRRGQDVQVNPRARLGDLPGQLAQFAGLTSCCYIYYAPEMYK